VQRPASPAPASAVLASTEHWSSVLHRPPPPPTGPGRGAPPPQMLNPSAVTTQACDWQSASARQGEPDAPVTHAPVAAFGGTRHLYGNDVSLQSASDLQKGFLVKQASTLRIGSAVAQAAAQETSAMHLPMHPMTQLPQHPLNTTGFPPQSHVTGPHSLSMLQATVRTSSKAQESFASAGGGISTPFAATRRGAVASAAFARSRPPSAPAIAPLVSAAASTVLPPEPAGGEPSAASLPPDPPAVPKPPPPAIPVAIGARFVDE
jgi:hypothetical protein